LIITRHACPNKILTDQDRQLISNLFYQTCENINIEHLERV